jgi:hypothetical protein
MGCVQSVLSVGDRIRALIIGMDNNYTRISLSTAELEERDGDMMLDRVRHSHKCLKDTNV